MFKIRLRFEKIESDLPTQIVRNGIRLRIPTVKLKIPGKSRIQKFCYIQVIVFDLSYLPLATVGIKTFFTFFMVAYFLNLNRYQ